MGQRHNERETERGIKSEKQNHINTDSDKCCFLALLHLKFLGRLCMFGELCVSACVHQI